MVDSYWWEYGYDAFHDGKPRPPKCFAHKHREEIIAGWDWAARGGGKNKFSIPSPESASASVSYDLDGSLQEPGIDDPYKDISR